MRYLMRTVGVAALLAIVATACAGADQPDAAAIPGATVSDPLPLADPANGGDGLSDLGPEFSVGEALASDLTDPALITGFLVTTTDGTVYLAEALAESFPPQPGRERLTVEGLDLSSIEDLTAAQGITWSDQPVQVFGSIENGTLVVSAGG